MTAEIERLAEMEKAATKAPWQLSHGYDCTGYPYFALCGLCGGEKTDTDLQDANAALIVALRNQAPALIEKARNFARAVAKLADAERECDAALRRASEHAMAAERAERNFDRAVALLRESDSLAWKLSDLIETVAPDSSVWCDEGGLSDRIEEISRRIAALLAEAGEGET